MQKIADCGVRIAGWSKFAIRHSPFATLSIFSWRLGVRPVTVTISVTGPYDSRSLRGHPLRLLVFGIVVCCSLLVAGSAMADDAHGQGQASSPSKVKPTTAQPAAAQNAKAQPTPAKVDPTKTYATKPEQKDEKVMAYKTMSGTVSGVGPAFLAVEFQRDDKNGASFEMALPLDPEANTTYAGLLKELQLGDTVSVEYRETATKDSQGQYTQMRRTATKIALVRRAPAVASETRSAE